MRVYHLEDFPQDKIRILLDDKFRKEMFDKLEDLSGNKIKLAKHVIFDYSSLLKLKKGINRGCKYYIPLHLLTKFSEILQDKGYEEFSMYKIERRVIAYKSNSNSHPILFPSLPLIEDQRLVRIVTHMLADGFGGHTKYNGDKKCSNPYYTNTRQELIEEFISDLSVFGNVTYRKKLDYKNRVDIPISIKHILEKFYNCKISASTGRLPKSFFNLSIGLKCQIIKAFCDDEASVRDNSILFVSANRNLIEDMRNLILTLGYNPTMIKFGKASKEYYSELRNDDVHKFANEIGFTHRDKINYLNFQLNRVRTNKSKFPQGITTSLILNSLKEGSKTARELSSEIGISQLVTDYHLRKLKSSSLIEKNKDKRWSYKLKDRIVTKILN